MGTSDTEKINRMHNTLYGQPGKPEESLMVQLVNTVKELKRLRVDHDTRMEEQEALHAEQENIKIDVSSNMRVQKNLVRIAWLIVTLIATTIYEMVRNG